MYSGIYDKVKKIINSKYKKIKDLNKHEIVLPYKIPELGLFFCFKK